MNSCNNHNRYIDDVFAKAEEICLKYNLRFTNLRRKIFTIIVQNPQPSKAYDILDILQKENSSAKPATIYRTLDFLLKYGLIHKLHISNSYVICHHPLQHKKCSFLICSKCNEVKECCDNDLTEELQKIGLRNYFHIEDSNIEIKGICNSCINNS